MLRLLPFIAIFLLPSCITVQVGGLVTTSPDHENILSELNKNNGALTSRSADSKARITESVMWGPDLYYGFYLLGVLPENEIGKEIESANVHFSIAGIRLWGSDEYITNSLHDVSRSSFYGVLKSSRRSLDYSHPDQDNSERLFVKYSGLGLEYRRQLEFGVAESNRGAAWGGYAWYIRALYTMSRYTLQQGIPNHFGEYRYPDKKDLYLFERIYYGAEIEIGVLVQGFAGGL